MDCLMWNHASHHWFGGLWTASGPVLPAPDLCLRWATVSSIALTRLVVLELQCGSHLLFPSSKKCAVFTPIFYYFKRKFFGCQYQQVTNQNFWFYFIFILRCFGDLLNTWTTEYCFQAKVDDAARIGHKILLSEQMCVCVCVQNRLRSFSMGFTPVRHQLLEGILEQKLVIKEIKK